MATKLGGPLGEKVKEAVGVAIYEFLATKTVGDSFSLPDMSNAAIDVLVKEGVIKIDEDTKG